MDLLTFALSWTPVLLLMVLSVGFKRPALELAVWGTLYTFGLVVWVFKTPPTVALVSALDGVITCLPISLVVLCGIMLSTLLLAEGVFRRLVDWVAAGVRGRFRRIVLIAVGVGNFMEGASVIAEPVVAPMLLAAGTPPQGAAALSIVGYAGLMTLEMAGVIITILTLVTGLPAQELTVASAWLSVPAGLAMAACVPLFLPRELRSLGNFAGVLLAGLIVGLTALAAAHVLGAAVAGMLGGLGLIVLMTISDRPALKGLKPTPALLRDLAPFGFILVVLLIINAVEPIRRLTLEVLVIKVKVVPIHGIAIQPFYSAYIYLALAFWLAVRLLGVPRDRVRAALRSGWAKGWRAMAAMVLFGAMGQVIAYSGYGPGFAELDQTRNLPHVLAAGLAQLTGQAYPLFVPFLGWVGTFLTGYGVAALVLFGPLQVKLAGLTGLSAVNLASALAVGSAIGSISSPFKIAIATPMCDAVGREGNILRLTIPLGVAASLVVGVFLQWLG